MNYELYIFDLDGTLLNTLGDLAASVNHSLRTNGLPEHTIEEVRMMVGNGVEKLIRRAVPADCEEALFQKVLRDFRCHYLDHSEDTTVAYDGIPELLQRLHTKGKKIAVASNKFDAATKQLCAKYFPHLIDLAVGENEAEGIRKKPAPDMVLSAISALHCDKSRTVYIGDSDVDIATARNAGIDCISVLWGFRSKSFLIDNGGTIFAGCPEEIFPISTASTSRIM